MAWHPSQALSSVNVKAFLRVIREGESNQVDDGPQSAYRAMYHPTQRRFWQDALTGKHPRHGELLPDGSGRVSTAFGAFQFTWTTWQVIGEKYDLADDIAPFNQECYAVALIHDVGALDDVIDGRFDEALRTCGKVWASLPNSSLHDGGSKLSYERALAVWTRYGGGVPTTVASAPPPPREQAPAPITEAPDPDGDGLPGEAATPLPEKPMAAPLLFIVPLLQSLFEAFSPLVRAKVTKALDKQGVDATASGQVADNLMAIVKGVAGQATTAAGVEPRAAVAAATDPLVAVATVKTSPQMLAAVEAQVSDYLDKIAPMLDRIEHLEQGAWTASEDSMDRAAARSANASNDDWMARALVLGILAAAGLLILFVGGVAIAQIAMLDSRTPTTEVWAAITGVIGTILGILGTVFAYRFGTSRTSSAKDVVIAEMAARRT